MNGFQVDVETILQPRRGDNKEQSFYIPDSTSDLYRLGDCGGRREQQPFTDLFTGYQKQTAIPDFVEKGQVGHHFFNNNTRGQIQML